MTVVVSQVLTEGGVVGCAKDKTLKWMETIIKGNRQQNSLGLKSQNSLLICAILGPLLFSIYTSDLPNLVNIFCDINTYTDDTKLHYCHSRLQKVE